MYIGVRKWGFSLYEYYICTKNNVRICASTNSWRTIGGAVRAAMKLATDLGIEYRENNHG